MGLSSCSPAPDVAVAGGNDPGSVQQGPRAWLALESGMLRPSGLKGEDPTRRDTHSREQLDGTNGGVDMGSAGRVGRGVRGSGPRGSRSCARDTLMGSPVRRD